VVGGFLCVKNIIASTELWVDEDFVIMQSKWKR
jgi:hypothetical protein